METAVSTLPKRIDLTGKVFGRLTVTGYAGTSNSGSLWYCDCACGRKGLKISGMNLRKGATKSCGCLHRETCKQNAKRMGENNAVPRVNVGEIYGYLMVIKRERDFSRYLCECLRCGSLISVTRSELVKGEKTMCDECARGL